MPTMRLSQADSSTIKLTERCPLHYYSCNLHLMRVHAKPIWVFVSFSVLYLTRLAIKVRGRRGCRQYWPTFRSLIFLSRPQFRCNYIFLNRKLKTHFLSLWSLMIWLVSSLHNKISIVQLENRKRCQSIAALGGPGWLMRGRYTEQRIENTTHFTWHRHAYENCHFQCRRVTLFDGLNK